MSLSLSRGRIQILGYALVKSFKLSSIPKHTRQHSIQLKTPARLPDLRRIIFANCSSLAVHQSKVVSLEVRARFALTDVEWESPNSPKAIWITIQEFYSKGKEGNGWHICTPYYVVEVRASYGLPWLTPRLRRFFRRLAVRCTSAEDRDGIGSVYRYKLTHYENGPIKYLKKEDLGFHLKQGLVANVPEACLVTYSILAAENINAGFLGPNSGKPLMSTACIRPTFALSMPYLWCATFEIRRGPGTALVLI